MTTSLPPLLTEEGVPVPVNGAKGQPHAGPLSPAPMNRDYPSADFYDDIVYSWSETGYEVRQALKTYSEPTHADR